MSELLWTWITLDVARLIPLVAVLFYAAKQDHKTGEVTNRTWLYAPIGFTLTTVEYVIFAPNMLTYAIVSMAITVATALILFYFCGKGWGGADTKALITLGMAYPLSPIYSMFLPLYPIITLWIALMAATIVMLIKKQKQIKFIPYLLVGFIIAMLI